jgi:hypothetical protein
MPAAWKKGPQILDMILKMNFNFNYYRIASLSASVNALNHEPS